MTTKLANTFFKYGVVGDYAWNESTFQSIFLTHYLSRLGHPNFIGRYGTLTKNEILDPGISQKWVNENSSKVFQLKGQTDLSIESWNRQFHTCFWFKPDFDLLKQMTPKTINIFFPRYYNLKSADIEFMRQCSYTAAQTEQIANFYKQQCSLSNVLLFPTDICYPHLTRNYLRGEDKQIVVILLDDEITLESDAIQSLLEIQRDLKCLKLIFITFKSQKIEKTSKKRGKKSKNVSLEESSQLGQSLIAEFGENIQFLCCPCDWDLHRLSPFVDWFVDLRSGSENAWFLALFSNADTLCLALDTPPNRGVIRDKGNGILLQGKKSKNLIGAEVTTLDIDELLFALYNIFRNTTTFKVLKRSASGESYKELRREQTKKAFAKTFKISTIRSIIFK